MNGSGSQARWASHVHGWRGYLLFGTLLALGYVVGAWLGHALVVGDDRVSMIWPASGVALFGLLAFGPRFWPWVLLGALIANLANALGFQAAMLVSLGSTGAALAGCYMLRLVGVNASLQRVRDVLWLIVLATGLSTMVAATVGALVLVQHGLVPTDAIGHTWLVWWIGDAMGNLLFAPFMLAWWYGPLCSLTPRSKLEMMLLGLCTLLVTQFVFGEQLNLSERTQPLAYLVFPFVTWGALRFGLRGVTSVVLLVGGVVMVNILMSRGLFAQGGTFDSMLLLWLYAYVLAITGLVLAAAINERHRAELAMRHQAQHDTLTGLPNRSTLADSIGQFIARARRHDRHMAVLFLDVDRFKTINDTLGHSVGDQLLIAVAKRLGNALRAEDLVVRHGGDEFVVLLEEVDRAEDVARAAEKLNHAVSQPFFIQDTPLHTSLSIGISLFPNDGEDAEQLLKHADVAMYRAKEMGRNNAAFYSTEMNARARERLTLENELRTALDEGRFELYYQPQFAAAENRIIGCEALLRWHKPGAMLVGPDTFIPVLEETGLITSVGGWVIDAACAQLAEWRARGQQHLRMSVNVSSKQLDDPDLPEHVAGALAHWEIPAELLELEITESVLVRHGKTTQRVLERLVERGVRLAVDDFGTGYSSLAYLHRLSVDTLKVDRYFVGRIPGHAGSEAVARAIVGLGQSLKLTLVAEGVETPEQRDFMQQLGCGLMQGYLYSKPLPAEAFARLLDPA